MTSVTDHRRAAERLVRRAWRAGPGDLLRVASAAFGFAVDVRHLLYETGILAAVPAPLPVVSVGGLTVGGSGKTPVAADLAGWLEEAGACPATVTHGQADELAVHRRLNPTVPTYGGGDRARALAAAARDGAGAAVLDDAFQHRRLARDLEVVLVDLDLLLRGEPRRLPAGPYRERWSELARADAVVIVRREASRSRAAALRAWLGGRLPRATLACCARRSGRLLRLRPEEEHLGRGPGGNGSAGDARADHAPPLPSVALLSVMKPAAVLRELESRGLELDRVHVLPDHAEPGPGTVAELVRGAGDRGIVGTLKDVVKLAGRVDEATPLWYLEERLEWEDGVGTLRKLVLERGRPA